MGDAENTLSATKKRAAGREISRDNPGLDDDEETSEQETGTFKKASEEVLAGRRFVKVRRPPPSATSSSNPFAGIQLIPSAVSKPETTPKVENEKKVPEITDGNDNAKEQTDESKGDDEVKTENVAEVPEIVDGNNNAKEITNESKGDEEVKIENVAKKERVNEANKSDVEGEKFKEVEKAVEENKVNEESAEKKDEKNTGTASFGSFKQLSSSQNAFTGIVGTGFSSSTFSFGVSKDGSSASYGSGFAFNFANNNGSSLFGTQGGSTGAKSEGVGFPSMQEVLVETGEENEKVVFTADSVLFEFFEGGWRERGKGEIKVNVPTTGTGKARLVMRTKGNYRLILNASLFPDMKLTNMDKKGITFACINSGGEGKEGLSTFALKFKDVSLVDEFRSVVDEHKYKASAVLRTPENSPKATDE